MPRMLFSFILEQYSLDPSNFSFQISFSPPFLSTFTDSSLALPSQLLSGATALKPQLRAYFIGTGNPSTFLWFLWLLLFFLARQSHTLGRKKIVNCGIWRQKSLILDPGKPFMPFGPWFPHQCSGGGELNSLGGSCQLWWMVIYHLWFLSNAGLIHGASEMLFFLFSLPTLTDLSSKASLPSPTQTSFPVPDSLYLASSPTL